MSFKFDVKRKEKAQDHIKINFIKNQKAKRKSKYDGTLSGFGFLDFEYGSNHFANYCAIIIDQEKYTKFNRKSKIFTYCFMLNRA